MKLNLSIRERIDLQSILPARSSYLNMKMIRKLREDLSFSDDEHKKIKLKSLPDGLVSWDGRSKLKKNISIPDTIFDLIKIELTALDRKNEITEAHLTLFDKFIDTDSR